MRRGQSDRPAPVVVFFYGGNWDSGSKAMYRFVGRALAARGVMTVIPDYRLYPQGAVSGLHVRRGGGGRLDAREHRSGTAAIRIGCS